MESLVEYELHTRDNEPTLSEGKLYRYILAENGAFVYAQNNYLRALIPVCRIFPLSKQISGLKPLDKFFEIDQKVSSHLLSKTFHYSLREMPNETLFHFIRDERVPGAWGLTMPKQKSTPTAVCPENPYLGYAPIEIHSHNSMAAFFSEEDDRDETGFRVYGVLGRLDSRPEIKMRVSIYGHWMNIPSACVFDEEIKVHDAFEEN